MNLPFQMSLKHKVAIVTGGSGVLGRSLVMALAEAGAKVAVLGRTQEKLSVIEEEADRLEGEVKGFSVDVLNKKHLEKVRDDIREQFGFCDILINGAGGNHHDGTTSKDYFDKSDLEGVKKDVKSFFDLEPEGINYVLQLNFLGTLLPTQVFAEDMVHKKAASIVNISSMNAFSPLTRIPAYSGAKAAVSNFTQWLAVHFSQTGIRVNAIAPGFFLTEQNYSLLVTEEGSPTERAQKILNQTPMNRFGEAEELKGTVLWLVNDQASSFVNGVVIPIDGGFSAYSGV
ncbi:SDR family oxidoreductase [Alteribacillus sp. YIM 98480]|uniref:SDR family oxidoreductase n=1 Tax=Alteribacillus sp. YIM 98480 TaxID=2606599 RepID=UPI00131BDBF2|nr:SDR family oxidoreductase [Alteribacillus sp. YIM 98480]